MATVFSRGYDLNIFECAVSGQISKNVAVTGYALTHLIPFIHSQSRVMALQLISRQFKPFK